MGIRLNFGQKKQRFLPLESPKRNRDVPEHSTLDTKQLLEELRRGDSAAAGKLHQRYLARLLQLVRQRLAGKLQRRVDPEDIVQSAYRTFFAHANQGDYVLQRGGDLWRLLAAIAINKLAPQGIPIQVMGCRPQIHDSAVP